MAYETPVAYAYARRILRKTIKIEDVPEQIQDQVKRILAEGNQYPGYLN